MSGRTATLEGKVAIVTGVSSGIGKAVIRLLAEDGAKVVGADIDAPGGSKTIADIGEAGGEGTFVQVDVTSEEQVRALVDTALNKYGRLDVMHNNAGIMPTRPSIEETTFEEYKRVISVDLDSVFLGCKYGIPAMKKTGGGRIINTASLAGIRPFMWGIPYTSAKAGVVMMSMGLGHLVEEDNIKVFAVCPTGVATNLGKGNDPGMRDMMRSRSKIKTYGPLAPEDIARGVHYLATRATFTAAALIVNATPENKPVFHVATSYDWGEPLTDI